MLKIISAIAQFLFCFKDASLFLDQAPNQNVLYSEIKLIHFIFNLTCIFDHIVKQNTQGGLESGIFVQISTLYVFHPYTVTMWRRCK